MRELCQSVGGGSFWLIAAKYAAVSGSDRVHERQNWHKPCHPDRSGVATEWRDLGGGDECIAGLREFVEPRSLHSAASPLMRDPSGSGWQNIEILRLRSG